MQHKTLPKPNKETRKTIIKKLLEKRRELIKADQVHSNKLKQTNQPVNQQKSISFYIKKQLQELIENNKGLTFFKINNSLSKEIYKRKYK